LLAAAQRVLDEKGVLAWDYRVDVLDLAKSDSVRFQGWEDLYIGSGVRVVAGELDVDATVEIESIMRRLDNPLPVELSLTNQTTTMGDLIKDIIDKLDRPFSVNDDGSRYPNIARQYDSAPGVAGHEYRDGDLKHVPGTPDGHMEFYDQDQFKEWTFDPESVLSDAAPLDVALVADAGVAVLASRADHVHAGSLVLVVADYTALVAEEPDDGTIGYISDKDWTYNRQNALWRKQGPFNVADATALAALTNANCGMVDGDTAYQEDIDRYWDRENAVWALRLTAKAVTTFPAIPTGPTIITLGGQTWYADNAFTAWRAMVMGTTKTGAPGST
jgi:hypothetical protein